MNELVNGMCELYKSGDTAAENLGKLAGTGTCSNLGIRKDTFIKVLESTYVKENDIMDAARNFARGKLSALASRNLSKNMEDLSNPVRNRLILSKGAMFTRMYRIKLIKQCCDAIQYLNFGVVQDYCDTLQNNPDHELSLTKLTSRTKSHSVLEN